MQPFMLAFSHASWNSANILLLLSCRTRNILLCIQDLFSKIDFNRVFAYEIIFKKIYCILKDCFCFCIFYINDPAILNFNSVDSIQNVVQLQR